MKLNKIKLTKKRIIFIIITIIVCLLAIYLNVNSKKEDEEQIELNRIKSYTSMDDFKSIKEIAKYLDCEYLGEEKSSEENYYMDIFMRIKLYPFQNNTNYRPYYEKLASYCCHYYGYKNLRIIDKTKDITVSIICNEDEKTIGAVLINGDSSYFEKQESINKINNFKGSEITNFKVESELINTLIKSKWMCKDSVFGTSESVFQSYKVYFDEGIQVKKVGNKVFNIILDENYSSNIVNGINTKFTKDEIIKKLGEPTFQDLGMKLYGYKGNDIYVFFDENEKQVSIYPVYDTYESEDFAKLIDEYTVHNDINKFVNAVKSKWNDYDVFEATDKTLILKYSLKGIVISFNYGLGNGVTVFDNYTGEVSKGVSLSSVLNHQRELPNNVFLENVDLVFEAERDRLMKLETLRMYGNSGDLYNEDDEIVHYQSKLFYECREFVSDGAYSCKFISIDGKFPNSELKEFVNSSLWVDDENLVYGVKNKGIFVYNAKTRNYKTVLMESVGEFELVEYSDGVLKYDSQSFKINF